ncbi:MAG TPA: GlsB/YeaQ/YmgE family stress response membrane protein [Gemmatimonadales bacterium]|nr:GlsB/YeaQ/YmgE family stress response membrane protein [Gemmatimonadales bacterium]
MNILVWIVVGLIAGSLASRLVTGKGKGCLADIVIGIIGALIGGWLASELHISINIGIPIIGQILIAFGGAVILLLVWGALFGRNRNKK